MLGELNETQIDNLLLRQAVGRIGCTDGRLPYIFPVTYVYDGKDIIGQTKEGMKLDIIRKNPHVCFEVDAMTNMSNWQCVLLGGTFLELEGSASLKARDYLFSHVWPLSTVSLVHAHEHAVTADVGDDNRIKPIMYRISITSRSGRFEKQ
jgi:uncharacterized protein